MFAGEWGRKKDHKEFIQKKRKEVELNECYTVYYRYLNLKNDKTMVKHPGADYHRMAAEHHEKAALHHKKAAEYYDSGNLQKAVIHAELAAVYHKQANDHIFNKQEDRIEHHEQYFS